MAREQCTFASDRSAMIGPEYVIMVAGFSLLLAMVANELGADVMSFYDDITQTSEGATPVE